MARIPFPHEPIRDALLRGFGGNETLTEFLVELESQEEEIGRPLLPWEEKELLEVTIAEKKWAKKGYLPPPPPLPFKRGELW